MKVLITGATGFIGSYLVKRIHGLGYRCRCLVRDLSKAKEIFKGFNEIEFVVGDITDLDSLENITEDIDFVFHLASIRGHDLPSQEAFERFRKVNVIGTKNIFKACLRNEKIKKIFHFSSTAVYGIPREHLLDEKTECRPYTPYQVSKYEADLEAFAYIKKGLPIVIFRPCKIYGPGFIGDFLIMAKIAKRGFYPKFGIGDNLFPALFISDMVEAVVLGIDKARLYEVYMIGPNMSNKQEEIALVMQSFFKKKSFKIYIPVIIAKIFVFILEKLSLAINRKPIVTYRNISSIVFDRVLNIDKTKRDLGFKPMVSLEEGLLKTLDWFESEGLLE